MLLLTAKDLESVHYLDITEQMLQLIDHDDEIICLVDDSSGEDALLSYQPHPKTGHLTPTLTE